MSEKNVQSQGIGTLGLLGVVFVTLKLTHYITWSWLWVTAPFWGGLAVLLAVVLALVGGGLFALIFKWALDASRSIRKQKKSGIR